MTFDLSGLLGRSIEIPTWMLFAIAGAGLALVASSWLRRPRVGDGLALYRISNGLGLGVADRRLLRRLANAAGVPTATSLLLSRGCFDRAATMYAASHGWHSRIDRVRATAFANGDART
ncbi:MAG: hypothetical protein KDA22_05195 [Phycisphaerales bacterium]|nr:hypothetical protein [Phycisphaerales bacterium]